MAHPDCRWTIPSRLVLLSVAYLVVGLSSVMSAQDLKPLVATIAARISASGRKTVAVVDFTDLDGNVTTLGRFLAEEASTALVEEAKAFEVIDRTHLKVILQEHRLSVTGLIDPQTARQLGKIAGVDALVTGVVTPLGDSIRLYVKVLDIESAKIVAASSCDIPKTPAIIALGNKESVEVPAMKTGTGSTPSKQGSPPEQISIQTSSFLFAIRSCRRQGDTLICVGAVTNKLERRRVININTNDSSAIDNNHNQYELQEHGGGLGSIVGGDTKGERVGGSVVLGTHGTNQEMEADLPINFIISIEAFDPNATSISIVLAFWTYDPYGSFKAVLRNIPVEK